MKRSRIPPWTPPWMALPIPTPAPVNPIDERRRDYLLVLIRALEKHFTESGTLDEKMADRIEQLMHDFWPNEVPAPAGVPGLDLHPLYTAPTDGSGDSEANKEKG